MFRYCTLLYSLFFFKPKNYINAFCSIVEDFSEFWGGLMSGITHSEPKQQRERWGVSVRSQSWKSEMFTNRTSTQSGVKQFCFQNRFFFTHLDQIVLIFYLISTVSIVCIFVLSTKVRHKKKKQLTEESPVTIHFDLLRIKLSTNVINNTSEPFQMQ